MREPSVEFDHHGTAWSEDPDGVARQLRGQCPVAWSPNHGGFWVVSDLAGNHEVLKNHEVFGNGHYPAGGDGGPLTIPKVQRADAYRAAPDEVDRPEHTELRRLLNVVMSPAAAEAMQPRIDYWVDAHIDAVIESGNCDLVYDLTSPVPAFITLEWLGYPREHVKAASEAHHDAIGYPSGHPRFDRAIEQMSNMVAVLEETVAARRTDPRDDVITYFIEQTVDGVPMTDHAIVEMCLTLIGGGVDTTTSLTSSALVHLHHDHELRQRLIDEPELLVPATEEFLRMYAPLTTIARTVLADVEVGGCLMEAGNRVLVLRVGANKDPAAFEDPEVFVPDRFPNRHTSFGLGIHRCSGAHLARRMFRSMITQVLARMPDYELDDAPDHRYADRGLVSGWTSLPTRFTPEPRSSATP